MTEGNDKVFISYRRSASKYFARAVFMHLEHTGHDVFFDIESIGPGEFESIIMNQIRSRAHFIVILAPGSMDRLKDPNDWLRKEIEYAIDQKRNIIPVMHSGYDFAVHGAFLTGKLEKIKGLQAHVIHDDYFEEGLDRLVNRYLKQPFYGEIVEAPTEFEAVVTRKKSEAQAKAEPTKEERTAEDFYNQAEEAATDKEAITFLTKAIELKPTYVWAYVARGNIYHESGAYEMAIADYDKAIALAPEDEIAYANRAGSLSRLGHPELAIESLHKAIELAPDNPNTYDLSGWIYGNIGKYQEAIDMLNRALEIDPEHFSALGNRAYAYNQLEKFEDALSDLSKAIELNPHDAIVIGYRANTHMMMKNYKAAIEDYTKAIELGNKTEWTYGQRGTAFHELGDYPNAIADYKKVLEINPDNEYLQDAYARAEKGEPLSI